MDFSLIVSWPAFIGALLLLWFLPSFWIRSDVKRSLSQKRTASEFELLRAFMAWQNWADLLRAFAGCYLLYHYVFDVPEGREWEVFGWRAAILFIALLLQTVRRHHQRFYFLAPIFFVWGITFFLSDPILAIYGIAAGTFAAMVVNLEWYLPVMAVVLAGVGYLLSGIEISILLNAVLVVFPLIVTFCGRGHMVHLVWEPSRKGESSRREEEITRS